MKRIIGVVVALVCSARPSAAQEVAKPDGSLHGVSVWFVVGDGVGPWTLKYQMMDFSGSRAGLDLSVATLPQGIAEGLVVLVPDLGVAGVVGRGASTGGLVVRGGWTSAWVAGGGWVGGTPFGIYLGVAILGVVGDGPGVRMDVTARQYRGMRRPAYDVSFGITSLGGLIP